MHRDIHKKAVAQWQAQIKADAGAKEAWNAIAQPMKFSGFDLFMKLCRRSQIRIDVVPLDPTHWLANISYVIGARPMYTWLIVQEPDNVWYPILEAIQLWREYPMGCSYIISTPGTYKFYLADVAVARVLGNIHDPRSRHCHTHESPQICSGEYAECTINAPEPPP